MRGSSCSIWLSGGTVDLRGMRQTHTLIEQVCRAQKGSYEIAEDAVMQSALRQAWNRQESYSDDDANNKEIAESELNELFK